jgi:hypothetical protein
MRRYSDRPDVYISVTEISVRDRWERSARREPVPQQWTAAQFDRAPVLALRLAPELGGQYKRTNVGTGAPR